MRCPICKKEVPAGSRYEPFCSERCQVIDLGAWASGKYAIPSEEQESEADDDRDRE